MGYFTSTHYPHTMPELNKTLYSCILFDKMDKEIVTEILSSSEKATYSIGDTLIQKGSVPKALFIIE